VTQWTFLCLKLSSWLNLNSVRFLLSFLALITVDLALVVAPPVAQVGAPLLGWAVLTSSRAFEGRADVERGLPDALDMLNIGVSQGWTVQSLLCRIGAEIAPARPALARELRIVNQQVHFGSLNVALYNFVKHLGSAEVTSFTSLLIQSEATDTSVSRALTDYSDSIRSTIRERADTRSSAAAFKNVVFHSPVSDAARVHVPAGPARCRAEQLLWWHGERTTGRTPERDQRPGPSTADRGTTPAIESGTASQLAGRGIIGK